MRNPLNTVAAIGIAAVSSAALLLVGQTPWLRAAENLISDYVQIHFSPFPPPSDDIVIVGIEEATLSGLPYRSPIDRGFLAKLIARIDDAKPKAIVVDLLIDAPTESQKDDRFLEVLQSTRAPIFVAYGTAADGLTENQLLSQETLTSGVNRVSIALARDRTDGVVRHFIGARRAGTKVIPSAAAVLAGSEIAPLVEKPMRLTFPGKGEGEEGAFAIYPANSVELLPTDWFDDKYVLIGAVLDLVDRYRTPFVTDAGDKLGSLPGVSIHAYALDQMLRGFRVVETGPLAAVLIAFFLCCAAAALLRSPLPLSVRILLILALTAAYGISVAQAYKQFAILLPAVVPASALLVCSALFGLFLWNQDRREKSFIRNAWSQYVSPEVVEQLISNPGRLKLGGEQRVVTYLFTDIIGFTSFAEEIAPEQVANILNPYLEGICNVLLAKGGTIDKIVGDAVIAMFGAPLHMPNQEQRAVEAALEIDRICTQFSVDQNDHGIKFGKTRIGVNTGPAMVGNFGGAHFFNYTGLGDTINTAARLESVNKICGTRICVSGSTKAGTSGIAFRNIGQLVLAGKGRPVAAYEPVPHLSGEHLAMYGAAYAEMATGSKCALESFARLLEQFPDDLLARCHLDRMQKSGVISSEIKGNE